MKQLLMTTALCLMVSATKQGEVSVQTAVKMAAGEKTGQPLWVPFELVIPENMAGYAK